MKKPSVPTYIIQNRLGIYYFQYRIPTRIFNNSKCLFRKSLRTRHFTEAVSLSKYVWVIMDSLNKKYFSDPVAYGKAMELLMRYERVEQLNWNAVESFLEELDVSDSELLELALKQRKSDSDVIEKTISHIQNAVIQHNNSLSIPDNDVLTKNNLPLSELINKWLHEKKPNLAMSSYQGLESRITIFRDIIYEVSKSQQILIAQLDADLIRQYRHLIENLPARRTGSLYEGKTYAEFAQMKVEKISSQTLIYNLDIAKQFLNWARLTGYQVDERLEGILYVARKNTPKTKSIQRVPFNDNDLIKIFEGENYLVGKISRASDYWVPLIALFTGARLGEICQLTTDDVKNIDGVWCFDINDDGDDGKLIKASGSKRVVPIHSSLIELGLIDYRNAVAKHSFINLFPKEIRSGNGRFSAIQKRLTHHFSKLNFDSKEKESKVFHSFRHLVRTRLVELDVSEGLIDAIVGHSSGDRSIGSKHYTHTQLIQQKNEAISKLHYKIDFGKIKKWQSCRFSKLELC